MNRALMHPPSGFLLRIGIPAISLLPCAPIVSIFVYNTINYLLIVFQAHSTLMDRIMVQRLYLEIPFELASVEWNYTMYVSNSLASLLAPPASDARILLGVLIAAGIIGTISLGLYHLTKLFIIRILSRRIYKRE